MPESHDYEEVMAAETVTKAHAIAADHKGWGYGHRINVRHDGTQTAVFTVVAPEGAELPLPRFSDEPRDVPPRIAMLEDMPPWEEDAVPPLRATEPPTDEIRMGARLPEGMEHLLRGKELNFTIAGLGDHKRYSGTVSEVTPDPIPRPSDATVSMTSLADMFDKRPTFADLDAVLTAAIEPWARASNPTRIPDNKLEDATLLPIRQEPFLHEVRLISGLGDERMKGVMFMSNGRFQVFSVDFTKDEIEVRLDTESLKYLAEQVGSDDEDDDPIGDIAIEMDDDDS